MRILIVGAGALGGYFGARLLAAGRDVTFLVREPRARALEREGLKVKSPLGDLTIPSPPTVTAETLHGVYDLIILSCKSWDLDSAIGDLATAVGDDSRVLPLLNGMRHLDVLDAHFGQARVLGGVARISSTLSAGEIHHFGKLQEILFGSRAQSDNRIAAVREALTADGFDARASDDVTHDMWDKWFFIAAAASLTGMMRAAVGDIVAGGATALATGLLEECAAVATANGFAPRAEAWQMGLGILTTPGSPFSASMLRDIENGSRIEAEHIVGNLLERKTPTLPTPLLDVALAHLRTYEARRMRLARKKD